VLIIGEDHLFDNEERKIINYLGVGDNQNDHEDNGQEPEFNMFGTALNEL
jgi:uncharacterized cupin superfamily protein